MGFDISSFSHAYHEAKHLYKTGYKKDAAITLAKGIKGVFVGRDSKPRKVITVSSFDRQTSTQKTEGLTSALSVGKGKNTLSTEQKAVHQRAVSELEQDPYFEHTPKVKSHTIEDHPIPFHKHVHIEKNATRSDGKVKTTPTIEPTVFGEKREPKTYTTNVKAVVETLETEGLQAFKEDLEQWSDIYDLFEVGTLLADKNLVAEDIGTIWSKVFTRQLADSVVEKITEEHFNHSDSQEQFRQLLRQQQSDGVNETRIKSQIRQVAEKVLFSKYKHLSHEQEQELERVTDSAWSSLNHDELQQQISEKLAEQEENHDISWEFYTDEQRLQQKINQFQNKIHRKTAAANKEWCIETRRRHH